jgi:hypothetical protein
MEDNVANTKKFVLLLGLGLLFLGGCAMSAPEIIQSNAIALAIYKAGDMISGAIVVSAVLRAVFNK